MDGPDDLIAALRHDPARTVLAFDFDGTLAPIVDIPADARAAPAIADLLKQLAVTYRTVAIISGRPVAFLAEQVPDGVELSGLYGLEARRDGEFVTRPGVDHWRAVVADAAQRADAMVIDGMTVEAKGLSITLHYRNRPAAAEDVRSLAADLGASTGLDQRDAKMSVELHPPVAADKGLALTELADGAVACCYVGDDLGDLPAFVALDALRRTGLATLAVAVATSEAPEALTEAADLVVDGPEGVVHLLERLLV